MTIQTDVSALISAAEAFDEAYEAMKPVLNALADAENAVRVTLVAEGKPLRDHLSGGAQIQSLALSLLRNSELSGQSLESIVTDAYGDLA